MGRGMQARQLADFEGRWRLTRRITPVGQPEAWFEGEAQWTPEGTGRMAYSEEGVLAVTGHTPMRSERRYVWDSDLNVWFEDGRFFHSVPHGGGRAEHWCDPDRYLVDYRFERWPRFEVVWSVKGPNKDYVSVTRYHRRGEGR